MYLSDLWPIRFGYYRDSQPFEEALMRTYVPSDQSSRPYYYLLHLYIIFLYSCFCVDLRRIQFRARFVSTAY